MFCGSPPEEQYHLWSLSSSRISLIDSLSLYCIILTFQNKKSHDVTQHSHRMSCGYVDHVQYVKTARRPECKTRETRDKLFRTLVPILVMESKVNRRNTCKARNQSRGKSKIFCMLSIGTFECKSSVVFAAVRQP